MSGDAYRGCCRKTVGLIAMQELIDFLDEQHTTITEYSETLTRRLVEKVTILDAKIVVTLKLGVKMEVEA